MIKKSSLYSLVFTIFNDGLGWGVILTLFAPLLMGENDALVSADTSVQARTLILGLLIAIYPFTQFVFMPLLGALSDHMGRKIVLKWTILCAGISFILSGIAISLGSLTLLFLSRFLAGVFSANAATAQAAIADISSEKEKAKNLSLSGIAGGMSWIVGPPIGGLLTSSYFSWADYATPLWFVAGLFFINYFWVIVSYDETYTKSTKEKHNWKQEIKDLRKLSKIPKMTPWILITLFFYFGWGFYVLFYPTLLVQHFQFDASGIGLFSGYLSIFWLLASLILNRGLAVRFKPEVFVLLGLPIAGLLMVVVALAPTLIWWYVICPIVLICGSLIFNTIIAVLSNLAGKDNQGKVFGVSQSLLSLGMFVSPLISGAVASLNERIPLTSSGVILVLTGVFASLYYFRRN